MTTLTNGRIPAGNNYDTKIKSEQFLEYFPILFLQRGDIFR